MKGILKGIVDWAKSFDFDHPYGIDKSKAKKIGMNFQTTLLLKRKKHAI